MKIVIDHVYPPIPIRTCDYVAYIDGDEESRRTGWGETASEALQNFIELYGETL
jgi:hypothetical protein